MVDGGIYKIVNKINGNIYIGSAINLKQRRYSHYSLLKRSKHHSLHLQNAFNKYGIDNFEFQIIEKVQEKERLIEREQYYIDFLKPEYNKCPTAGSALGRKASKETKKKMSEMRKGEFSACSKLTWKEVNEIRKLYSTKNESYLSLSKKYDVMRATIAHIIKNKIWIDDNYVPPIYRKWISKPGLNSKLEYKQIIELKEDRRTGCHVDMLAKKYNVSRAQIYRILNGECWGENT